ncbi:MAG TPA: thiamine phosphate synthase [Acidimicrobiales bacterium]|nr:thiamine phosphate synthase [Acidimicrobiales bacterium]
MSGAVPAAATSRHGAPGAGRPEGTGQSLPLPALVVVTDGSLTRGRPLSKVVGAAIEGGARAVLMREKHLSGIQRHALADELRALLRPVDGILLVASGPAIPSDGLHLASADALPKAAPALLGRSCHSAGDVAAAAAQGCQYATLSPIFPSTSKPGYGPALGPGALRGHSLPVWALGGVGPTNAGACLEAGASGVAVMGLVMRAEDPTAAVATMCAAIVGAGRDKR